MKRTALSALAKRITEPPISWLMKVALDRPDLISLAAGFTDNETLPVDEAREVAAAIFSAPRTGRPALQYGSTLGDDELRTLTAERLRQQDSAASKRDLKSPRERIVMTHGSQQFLYLLTECLCDSGDLVLVEDPTYFVFLSILQSHGVGARGIPIASDGIDLDALDRKLDALCRTGGIRKLKLLYLVSYFQNPTGITTSFEKKERALELLRRCEKKAGHPIYLLEDAAYRELRFAGPDVASALAAKHADRVIYTGTYSKPFATGIRVGYGILPEPLFTPVVHVKGNHDFGTSNLLQQILRGALTSGLYDKHLPILQQRYGKKAAAMLDALAKSFPAGVTWQAPLGGMNVWAQLPGAVSAGGKSRLFRKALDRGVFYVPGEFCFALDPARPMPRNSMRLSFGSATDLEIRKGIGRLGAVLREAAPFAE